MNDRFPPVEKSRGRGWERTGCAVQDYYDSPRFQVLLKPQTYSYD